MLKVRNKNGVGVDFASQQAQTYPHLYVLGKAARNVQQHQQHHVVPNTDKGGFAQFRWCTQLYICTDPSSQNLFKSFILTILA